MVERVTGVGVEDEEVWGALQVDIWVQREGYTVHQSLHVLYEQEC